MMDKLEVDMEVKENYKRMTKTFMDDLIEVCEIDKSELTGGPSVKAANYN